MSTAIRQSLELVKQEKTPLYQHTFQTTTWKRDGMRAPKKVAQLMHKAALQSEGFALPAEDFEISVTLLGRSIANVTVTVFKSPTSIAQVIDWCTVLNALALCPAVGLAFQDAGRCELKLVS